MLALKMIINPALWIIILNSIIKLHPLPYEYYVRITPIIHGFAIPKWYVWFFVSATIIFLRVVLIKLGPGFLRDIKKIPFSLSLQKQICNLLAFLLLLLLIGITCYMLTVLFLGLLWFKQLGFILWIGKLFLPGFGAGIFSGLVLGIFCNRAIIEKHLEPACSKRINAKLSQNDDDRFSDIRHVFQIIVQTKNFDPLDFIKINSKNHSKDKCIFVGKHEFNQPIYITQKQFFATHIQIMGCTGSGKGIAATCMMGQLILAGISTIVFDPKRDGDEWAPHVLKMMAHRAHKKFHLINLQADKPQINLLKNITADELNELLQASMGIQDVGSDSDYYRRKDRKAAMKVATLAGAAECIPHIEALALKEFSSAMNEAESFRDQLEILAQIKAVQTTTGIDLREAIYNGDCIYIIGTDNIPQIQLLQKMILLRIKQLIERRDRLKKHRHVTVFVDELKCFLTRPVLVSLAMIRDHGCNFILAHQAPGDLFDVSKDMDGKATYSGVTNNTNIKLIYKLNDSDDQYRAAALTGEKIVQREHKEILTNTGMGELIDTDKKHIMPTKEYLYPQNVFGALQPRVGVIIGVGIAKLCFTAPIKVRRGRLEVEEYEVCRDYSDKKGKLKNLRGIKPINIKD